MRPHISGAGLRYDGHRRAGTARPTILAHGKSQGFHLPTPKDKKGGWRAGGRPTLKTMKTASRPWNAGGKADMQSGRGRPAREASETRKTSKTPMFPIIGKTSAYFPTIGKKVSNHCKTSGRAGVAAEKRAARIAPRRVCFPVGGMGRVIPRPSCRSRGTRRRHRRGRRRRRPPGPRGLRRDGGLRAWSRPLRTVRPEAARP